MSQDKSSVTTPHKHPCRNRNLHQTAAIWLSGLLLTYFAIAYVLLPLAWFRYVERHPAFDEAPNITITSDDHPGDPLNVGLIGTEEQVKQLFKAAGWYRADALGLRSDLKIAADTVLEKSYDDAPVSSLFLFGRKEDLAYEQPVGGDPSKRHHVRFWKSAKVDQHDRPLWFGSATYDKRVGLSHTTGQITHHIDGDIDAEREHLFGDLTKTGEVVDEHFVDHFQKVDKGFNGGGDEWHTDGRLRIGTVKLAAN